MSEALITITFRLMALMAWKIIGRCILITDTREAALIHLFFNTTFHLSIRFIIFHIILDRFLYIWLSIQYPIYVSNKKLRKVIIIQWFLSVFLSLIVVLILTVDRKGVCIPIISKVMRSFYIAIDALIIATSLSTLIYLFSRVKRVTKSIQKKLRCQNSTVNVWFKLKIPCLMVATFILFNTSSTLVRYNVNLSKRSLSIVFVVLDISGWCSDAIIYIFLQKRARRIFTSMFQRSNATSSSYVKE